jgi:hypothetical protein
MKVGQISQTVEVSVEAPTVELVSSTISGNVDQRSVVELPLNGRSWVIWQPSNPEFQVSKPCPTSPILTESAAAWEINCPSRGSPTAEQLSDKWISMNDYTNGAPGSMLGGNLGVDAIQEFTVLTTNYSAANGRTSGGVISAVTKSGANTFHGSAYEFLRNSALDARNIFDGPQIPPFRRNQFGASAGAPIQKDKTFVFADYEGLRQALAVSNFNIVPSPAVRGIGLTWSGPTTLTGDQIRTTSSFRSNPSSPLTCVSSLP